MVCFHPHYWRETPEHIGSVVWAEIPEVETNDTTEIADFKRRVAELVLKYQTHVCNDNSACWKDGRCSKRYPRPYAQETTTDGPTIELRRRAPVGDKWKRKIKVTRGNASFDYEITNRHIVPYNPYLLLLLEAHHCLEIVRGPKSASYTMKYILKGSDRTFVEASSIVGAEGGRVVDYNEIRHYKLTRVMGPNEAFDKTMGYDITFFNMSVELLPLHLPGKAMSCFRRMQLPQNSAENSSCRALCGATTGSL